MERYEDEVYKAARELSCLRRVSGGDLRTLLRYGRHATYRGQRALCYQSDPARDAFLVFAGRVRCLKYRADESCLVVGRAEECDWVGLSEVLLSSLYLTDAVAEERTQVLVFSHKALGEVMKVPPIKDHLLEYLAKSVFLLHSQIELNLPLPRIVQYVLTHARKDDDGTAYLATTQDEIAQAVGVTRETVNKHLQSLQAQGLVQIGRGRIGVSDCGALEESILD